MTTVKPLKKRAVAGTFLFRFLEDNNSKKVEVALFRRSGKVRTYQHKLAPVSGSVEEDDANPLATALREIKEETTLDLTSIELLRKGKPYSFTDDDISREWTINPFAFRLKSVDEGGKGEAGIFIDWEHDGWEWHDPLEVNESEEFGGVPRLLDSLRRVWPECDLGAKAGAALTSGLESLRNDHESGARQLASKAVGTLRDVIAELDTPEMGNGAWWSNVRMTAWHLCYNGRESMGAAIITSMVTVLDRIEAVINERRTIDEELKQHIVASIDTFLSQRDSAVERIRDSFISYVRSNMPKCSGADKVLSVLTLSSSSTISCSILEAAAALNLTVDLRILESRPLFEGVTLASKLLQEAAHNQKVNISLYADASAAIAAEGVDLILFGADRISSTGDVSNKTGTLPAVLSTRHVSPNARVVVLSEVEKIAGPGTVAEHVVEENDPAELSRGWEQGVKGTETVKDYFLKTHGDTKQSGVVVRNVYFEWVPATLIDAYITDEGLWSTNEIHNKSDWIGQETNRFFEGL
ncbi:hypothetical protein TruAng_005225 [Truncatella angustata]|nr:hypothetical protein TruAng_005225 [Truncatella angustata]